MKTFRRILLFIFILGFAAFLFANTKVKATPLNTSNQLVVEGAAIRTSGHAGMKFAANVGSYDTTNVTAYGIAIAYGSVSASNDFKVGGTINERAVLSTTVDELDEGRFYIVLWNIPEASYIQDVTARAFVIDNGEYVYGEAVVVRNIYQVANAVKEDVGYVTNDYIESIVAAFHTLTYHYNGSIVGYASYSELVADFVSDFNATTGKSVSAAGLYGAGATAHATFFNNDAMNAKWSWLIDSLENLRQHGYGTHAYCETAYAHAKSKTLNKDDSHDMGPIRENVQGFMTKTNCASYSASCAIDFSSGDVQELMFELLTDEKLVQSGGALVANPTRDGYTFAGWYDNPSFTGSAVENVGENTDLYAKWNLNTYNVTFMDGESVLDLSPSTYNIKQAKNLPDYDKPGFIFDGWYDNPSFTGDEKTEINVGTFGDLVFYAKTTEITGYTVTFNYNGGNTYYEDIDAVIADYLADYNTYNSRSYTTTTYSEIGEWDYTDEAVNFFYDNLSKWGWLVDFFATNASTENKPAYGAFRNYNNYTGLNAASSNYRYEVAYETRGWVGKILYNRNVNYPTTDWSDEDNQALTMAWLSNVSQTEYLNNNGTVALSTLVPHVYKQGYTFDGWYDNPSFTGDPVTSVTEATTLYAKWGVYNKVNLTLNLDGGYYYDYNLADIASLKAMFKTDAGGASFDGKYANVAAETAFNVKMKVLGKDIYKWDFLIAYFADVNDNGQMQYFFNYYLANHNYPSASEASAAGLNYTYDNYYLSYESYAWYSSYASSWTNTNSSRNIVTKDGVYNSVTIDEMITYLVSNQINTFEIIGDTTLPTVYKDGYTFAGWYANSDFSGDAITIYPKNAGDVKSVTLYAKWIAN